MQHLHDALNEFLSEHALTARRGRTRTPDFYDAFNTWAGEEIPRRWIIDSMAGAGFAKGKYNGRMVFRGIILRSDPRAADLNCEPYTPRPHKPRPAVRTGRGAWTPGQVEWDALRDDLAGLRADVVALAAVVRAGGEMKGARRRGPVASAVQLSLAGLEPPPAGQPTPGTFT